MCARIERVMYSGVSTDGTRGGVVIPAYAGIQAAPRLWIPAYAGMALHLYIHTPYAIAPTRGVSQQAILLCLLIREERIAEGFQHLGSLPQSWQVLVAKKSAAFYAPSKSGSKSSRFESIDGKRLRKKSTSSRSFLAQYAQTSPTLSL